MVQEPCYPASGVVDCQDTAHGRQLEAAGQRVHRRRARSLTFQRDAIMAGGHNASEPSMTPMATGHRVGACARTREHWGGVSDRTTSAGAASGHRRE